MAKAAGVPVFLDAGGMEGPLSPGLLSCLTVLSPNETELARMTNMPTDTIEQVEVWRGCGGSVERVWVGPSSCFPHSIIDLRPRLHAQATAPHT